jgi:hypothetical protein
MGSRPLPRRPGDGADLAHGRKRGSGTRSGTDPHPYAVAVARSLHARPHQPGGQLHRGRGTRPGHAWRRRRRGDRLQPPRLEGRRSRRIYGRQLAGIRGSDTRSSRCRGDQPRTGERPAAGLPVLARHAGTDGLYRRHRNRTAETRRHAGGVGGFRRRRSGGRPDRQADGCPRRRHRRIRRQARPLPRTRLRRRHQPPHGNGHERRHRGSLPAGRQRLLRQYRAVPSTTPFSPTWRPTPG